MFNPQAPRPEASTRELVFRQSLAAAFKSLRQSIPAAPETLPALLASCDHGSALTRPECRAALSEIRARLFQIPGRDVEAQAFWQEGLAGALFAARVAQLKQAPVAASFMGALLHRAGEALALKILARVELEYRMKLDSSSRREWCASHSAELGERLVRKWNLPERGGLPTGALEAAAPESQAVYFGRLFAIELLQPEFCVPGALDHAAADLGLSAELVAVVRKEDPRSLLRALG
jgi:HDOD domain-containing protein